MLRNIPVGGSGRKSKYTKRDQPSIEIPQFNHHQPFLHVKKKEFVGFYCDSSLSGIAVGNHFGSLPEIHGNMVLLFRSFPPIGSSDFHDGSFQQDNLRISWWISCHNGYRHFCLKLFMHHI